MKIMTVLLAATVAAALAHPVIGDDAIDFKVVVHADNPTTSLPSQEVAKLFLKKARHWDSGAAIVPVDQDAHSRVRQAFSKAIHGRSTTSVQHYWQRRILSGEDTPPSEVQSDALVQKYLESEPWAIGYVSAGVSLSPTIRVLEIPDLPGYEAAAFDNGSRAPRARSSDETVSQHGDLHLFLTGACGQSDQGRQTVLENRDPHYAVSAVIETSIWDGKWLKSSSVSHHTLDPLEEKGLGCNRQSGDIERRHAIVSASSATSHKVDRRPNRPARSVVAIVDSGSCGQGRAGQWRSIINRHTLYEVTVAVEVRELVGDRLNRRYRKTHRLAPGASRRLGCGADGKMTRRFTVLEAKYR